MHQDFANTEYSIHRLSLTHQEKQMTAKRSVLRHCWLSLQKEPCSWRHTASFQYTILHLLLRCLAVGNGNATSVSCSTETSWQLSNLFPKTCLFQNLGTETSTGDIKFVSIALKMNNYQITEFHADAAVASSTSQFCFHATTIVRWYEALSYC